MSHDPARHGRGDLATDPLQHRLLRRRLDRGEPAPLPGDGVDFLGERPDPNGFRPGQAQAAL